MSWLSQIESVCLEGERDQQRNCLEEGTENSPRKGDQDWQEHPGVAETNQSRLVLNWDLYDLVLQEYCLSSPRRPTSTALTAISERAGLLCSSGVLHGCN